VASFAFEDQLGHGGPGIEILDFVAEGCVGDWPVHVVEVQVVELEVFESDVDAFFDVLGVVAVGWLVAAMRCLDGKSLLVVPELAGDPEVFSLQSCLGQTIGNALSNKILVLVGGGTIYVPVPGLDCPGDSFCGILTVEVPSTESQQWNRVQSQSCWS
jgi:hypothetical protein